MNKKGFGIVPIFMVLVFVTSALALNQMDAKEKAEERIEQLEQQVEDCEVGTG